jgi:hypothetical protein
MSTKQVFKICSSRNRGHNGTIVLFLYVTLGKGAIKALYSLLTSDSTFETTEPDLIDLVPFISVHIPFSIQVQGRFYG